MWRSSVVCVLVCLSVGHNHEPCKNDWTSQDADCVMDLGGTKDWPCIRWCPDYPQGKGQFLGCHPLKYIRLCKQQMTQQHGAADLSACHFDHTHTRLTALFPVPVWILLKQETVSGSGISCAICKSAPCSRQTTTPAPHQSVFYRPDAFPAAQPTASNH